MSKDLTNMSTSHHLDGIRAEDVKDFFSFDVKKEGLKRSEYENVDLLEINHPKLPEEQQDFLVKNQNQKVIKY